MYAIRSYYEACVKEAHQLSDQGFLVTFGIHPTHAETAKGLYIVYVMLTILCTLALVWAGMEGWA